jgi:NAD-specific glutamate dehydrogenase
VRDHGAQAQEAIRAWIIAGDILDLHTRAENLRAHAYLMTAEAEVGAFLALARATRSASEWALRHCKPEVAIADAVGKLRPVFQSLGAEFESMLLSTERERFERIYRDLRATVNEETLAHELVRLAFADHLLGIIGLSLDYDRAIQATARVYFGLCEAIDFASLETALSNISPEDPWERRAAREMADELGLARLRLAEHLLDHITAEVTTDRLRSGRERELDDALRLIAELKSVPTPSIAALHVVVRSISRLAEKA